jgi:3-polyprenyl-4-hydroxybenzoate decarboxylase
MVPPATNPLLHRVPATGVAGRDGELLIVGADRSVRQLSGDSAQLARTVLSFLAAPHSRAEIAAHLERLSGKPLENPQVVEDLLKLLLSAGVLHEQAGQGAGVHQPAPRAGATGARVVLGLTGAIATAHAPTTVSLLLERGFDVEIAATRDALRMVSRLALEAITHRRVHTSLRGHDPSIPVPHIRLAEWAEAVLVYPATATTLARIAHGDCSELVAALVLSTRAPVLVVPSMNPAMLGAPAVQRNLETLRQDGIWIADPAIGLEVAQAPAHRQLLWGAAPPPGTVLPLLDALLTLQREKPAPS